MQFVSKSGFGVIYPSNIRYNPAMGVQVLGKRDFLRSCRFNNRIQDSGYRIWNHRLHGFALISFFCNQSSLLNPWLKIQGKIKSRFPVPGFLFPNLTPPILPKQTANRIPPQSGPRVAEFYWRKKCVKYY